MIIFNVYKFGLCHLGEHEYNLAKMVCCDTCKTVFCSDCLDKTKQSECLREAESNLEQLGVLQHLQSQERSVVIFALSSVLAAKKEQKVKCPYCNTLTCFAELRVP